MNRKRYKYIHRLVDKITTSPSNNMEFLLLRPLGLLAERYN